MLVMLLVLVQIYSFSHESQQIWAKVAVSLKIEFFTQYLLEELSWDCLDYTDSVAVFTVCLCREYWPKRCRFAFLIMQPREETWLNGTWLSRILNRIFVIDSKIFWCWFKVLSISRGNIYFILRPWLPLSVESSAYQTEKVEPLESW